MLGQEIINGSRLTASQLGCVLDCDVMAGTKIGGGTPTDNTAAINAYLSTGTATNPVTLILDGGTATTGVILPAGGHATIEGLGRDTGFFMLPGSNNDVIRNGASLNVPSDPGGSAPGRGANVRLANFTINGNRGDGHTGNSTTGDARGNTASDLWFFGVDLVSLDYVTVENVRFYNTSAYNLRLGNVGHAHVDNCHFENSLPGVTVSPQNSDGVHINGPANDVSISNCFFRTGDDAIALNAPEGYSGLITRVAIVNCTAYQAQTMMRIYAGSQTSGVGVDGVTITNYQGSANVVGFILGLESSRSLSVADAITNVTFANCKVSAPGFCWIQDNVGVLRFVGCDWLNGTRTEGMITGCSVAATVSSLVVAASAIVRTNAGGAATGLLDNQNIFGAGAPGITFSRVLVNGFQIVDAAGHSGGAVPSLIHAVAGSVTVTRLALAGVDGANISAIAGSGAAIGATAGALL